MSFRQEKTKKSISQLLCEEYHLQLLHNKNTSQAYRTADLNSHKQSPPRLPSLRVPFRSPSAASSAQLESPNRNTLPPTPSREARFPVRNLFVSEMVEQAGVRGDGRLGGLMCWPVEASSGWGEGAREEGERRPPNPAGAPKPLPTLIPSNLSPKTDFQWKMASRLQEGRESFHGSSPSPSHHGTCLQYYRGKTTVRDAPNYQPLFTAPRTCLANIAVSACFASVSATRQTGPRCPFSLYQYKYNQQSLVLILSIKRASQSPQTSSVLAKPFIFSRPALISLTNGLRICTASNFFRT